MKYTHAARRYSFCVFFICLFSITCSGPSHDSTSMQQSGTTGIPRLIKQGSATQLVVDGEPYLILGGELHNSSSSSLEYMKPIWPKLTQMNLNTVLAPISWELLEPEEGAFDFTLVDGLINDARSHNLRLVFLWFGSWKNTFSSYVPGWVKEDIERFPRVMRSSGEGTERLTPLSETNRDADARAFAALMRRIREIDGDRHTVLMVQVENEPGCIPEARDYSETANQAYRGPVPEELLDYMLQNREHLVPEFRKLWEGAGARASGTWEEVFGKQAVTEDLFMAWHYACYIDAVVQAGKEKYPLPMFVNAALIRPNYPPGRYNSGGPLPHSFDIWKVGGPHIDFFAPDIYFTNFIEWTEMYTRGGNPLFIPETYGDARGVANAFYTYAKLDGIGFCPFGIESLDRFSFEENEAPDNPEDLPLAIGYEVLRQLTPLIIENMGTDRMTGVLLEENDEAAHFPMGDYMMDCYKSGRGSMLPGANAPGPLASWAKQPAPKQAPPLRIPQRETVNRSGALFISLGPDEYLIAGSSPLTVEFTPNTPGPPLGGISFIDEGNYVNGAWVPGRRLNGDENAQGQRFTLRDPSRIYRVKAYRYR
jgi:hypothetical protein